MSDLGGSVRGVFAAGRTITLTKNGRFRVSTHSLIAREASIAR